MACESCRRTTVRIVSRGLCNACYQRWRKTGSTEYQRWGKQSRCQIDDCDGRAISHGLCDKHRLRLRKHGHTDLKRDSWGAVSKHPLNHTWKWMQRHRGVCPIAPEWEKDFLQFAMDVGERPSPKHKLFAADDSLPIGPNNFVWKMAITERVPGEDERTYQNRVHRVYRAVRKEAFRGYDLKKRYGVSFGKYEEMLKEQNGKCAICGNGERATYRGKVREMAIDHCHKTGVVRGLLCTPCNTLLGLAEDDVERLRSAIAYLEKHAKKDA